MIDWIKRLFKTDIRFKTLKHFENLKASTAETFGNEWLSKQHKDLGTIRRSLIDLIESDFIRLSSIGKESPVEWLEREWNSTTTGKKTSDDEDKMSSQRLIRRVGDWSKVADARIYTTVKGLVFIKDYRKSKNDIWNKIFMVLFTAAVTYSITTLLNKTQQSEESGVKKSSQPCIHQDNNESDTEVSVSEQNVELPSKPKQSELIKP